MTTPRGPNPHVAALPVDAAAGVPPLEPIRRQLTAKEIAGVDDWCCLNLSHWDDPEVRAAFRRALIEKPDFRQSVLGWVSLP